MNQKTALSDSFFRQESEIKTFLATSPTEPTRYPKQTQPLTYYRPQDIVSFELGGKYVAAYVYGYGGGGAPVVGFYDGIFDQLPSIEDLQGRHAYGHSFPECDKTGNRYFEKYAIDGMIYMPDPAEQITLIASSVDLQPDKSSLEESMSLDTHLEIYDVQKIFESISHRLNNTD